MELLSFEMAAGAAYADGCARSRLGPILEGFTTVFTGDVEKMRRFYGDLFKEAKLRFEAEDLAVFQFDGGHELVIQRAGEDSKFAELVGKQTFGFTFPADKIPDSFGLGESAEFGWDEETMKVRDPDGNSVLLTRSGMTSQGLPDIRRVA